MSYVEISLETLRAIAKKIATSSPYIFSNDDFELGRLLSQLTKDETHLEAARGLLVYAIVNEMPNLTGVFVAEGIEPSALQNDQCLIHLVEFYNYVKTEFEPHTIPYPYFSYSKEEFEKMVATSLREIVSTDLKVNELTSAVGTLEVLRDFIKILPQKYRDLTTDPDNPDRQLIIEFIQFVDTHCLNHAEEIKIRLGLLLFVVMHIAFQYKHLDPNGTFFTRGSELYKLCISFLKVTHHSQLTSANRDDLLRQLSDLLGTPDLPEKFGALNAELRGFRDELEVKDEFSHEMREYKAIKKVTSFGLMFFGAHAALLPAGPLGLVAPPAYLTLYIYSGDPSQVGTKIYDLMNYSENLLTRITLGLYSHLFDKIYTATSGVNVMKISTQEGHKELLAFMTPENQKRFDDWINALLSLPEPILKKAERDSICSVLGRPDPALSLKSSDAEVESPEGFMMVSLPSSSTRMRKNQHP